MFMLNLGFRTDDYPRHEASESKPIGQQPLLPTVIGRGTAFLKVTPICDQQESERAMSGQNLLQNQSLLNLSAENNMNTDVDM
jgi:hypothetical protein